MPVGKFGVRAFSLPDHITNIDDKPLFFIMRNESEFSALSSIVVMSLSTKSPIL
jgi:hypothetical protein